MAPACTTPMVATVAVSTPGSAAIAARVAAGSAKAWSPMPRKEVSSKFWPYRSGLVLASSAPLENMNAATTPSTPTTALEQRGPHRQRVGAPAAFQREPGPHDDRHRQADPGGGGDQRRAVAGTSGGAGRSVVHADSAAPTVTQQDRQRGARGGAPASRRRTRDGARPRSPRHRHPARGHDRRGDPGGRPGQGRQQRRQGRGPDRLARGHADGAQDAQPARRGRRVAGHRLADQHHRRDERRQAEQQQGGRLEGDHPLVLAARVGVVPHVDVGPAGRASRSSP